MKRRTFLSRSALGTGALALGAPAFASGCAGVDARAALRADGAAELIARLQRGLGRVRSVPAGTIARALSTHPRPRLAEDVFRLGLEALVVLDVTRSLPDGAALPAPLAEHLVPELPVLDRYTSTYSSILREMPRSARRRLNEKVRERPGATMDVAGWIDDHARELGVASESRLLLRGRAAEVDVRMRRQSPAAVIDDCVAKVDRVLERSGAAASVARASAASAMMATLWQQIDGVPAGGGGGLSTRLSAPVVPPPPSGPPPELLRLEEDRVWAEATTPVPRLWSARWARPGDEELEIGGIMMPLGLVTCGLLLIVGLIVTLVGAAQNSGWDGLPRMPSGGRG